MPDLTVLAEWVRDTFGVDPRDYPAGAKVAPSNDLPQPMQADCKVVHGKVPGPENHLLCAAHGHVVDIHAQTIIAHDLKDYEKRGLGKTSGHASAPSGNESPKSADATPSPAGTTPNTTAPPSVAAPQGPPGSPNQDGKKIDAVALQVIGNQIVEYLHNQYNDLAEGVETTAKQWSDRIDKLKEAAPKEPGGLLSQLGKTLASLTMVAFPELEVVEVTMAIKEFADKGQEGDQQRKEAAEAQALFASKMQAKAALDSFVEELKKEARNARSKLVARVREAIKNFVPPADFDEKILEDMDKYVREFAVKQLNIKIGNDYEPGAVEKIQTRLGAEIGTWLKHQYVAEHEAEKTNKEVFGFAAMQQYLPPDVKQEKLEEFFQDNPDIKAKIDAELGEDYYDEFRKKVWGEKD